MANKIAISGLMIAALGLGTYFGAPVIAEQQAQAALDRHFSSLPAAQSGSYDSLAVDLWKQTARIGQWVHTLQINLPVQGQTDVNVTISGLRLDGLTVESLSSLQADGLVKHMADTVTWDTVVATDAKTGATIASTGAGEIKNLSGDHLNFGHPELSAALTADGVDVSDLQLTLANSQKTRIQVGLDTVTASGLTPDHVKSAALAGVSANVDWIGPQGTGSTAEQQYNITQTLGSISAADIRVSTNTVALAKTAYDALRIGLKIDDKPASELTIANYVGEGEVLSRRALSEIWSIPDGLNGLDKKSRNREIMNRVLTATEHMVEDGQGSASSRTTGAQIIVPGIMDFAISGILIENAFGLKGEKAVLSDVRQVEKRTGQTTSYRQMISTGIDMSKLPGHFRGLFGPDLNALDKNGFEQMLSKGQWDRILTDMDFGTSAVDDYAVSIKQPMPMDIRIAKISQRLSVSKSGLIDTAIVLTDTEIPTAPYANNAARDPMQKAILARVGDILSMDLTMDMNYDLTKNLLDIRSLGLGVDRIGKTAVTTRLTLPPMAALAGSAGQPGGGMMAMSQTMIQKTMIRLQDDGLLDIILANIARKQGAAVDAVRQQFATVAKLQGQQMGSDRTAEVGNALSAFIATGGGLKVDANITQPQPLLALMAGAGQPGAVLDLLKISAKHLPKQ